jgi:hypothetical protein
VRKKLFAVALSAAVVGSSITAAVSQTSPPVKPSSPQKNPGPQTSANPPKRSIPPELVKQCMAQFATGSTKIIGPFSEGSFSNALTKWAFGKRRLIIAAPSVTNGFGGVARGYAGCMFSVEDGGGFELVRALGNEQFPQRYTRLPGDPPQAGGR